MCLSSLHQVCKKLIIPTFVVVLQQKDVVSDFLRKPGTLKQSMCACDCTARVVCKLPGLVVEELELVVVYTACTGAREVIRKQALD